MIKIYRSKVLFKDAAKTAIQIVHPVSKMISTYVPYDEDFEITFSLPLSKDKVELVSLEEVNSKFLDVKNYFQELKEILQ
jgi:hypothetical protein